MAQDGELPPWHTPWHTPYGPYHIGRTGLGHLRRFRVRRHTHTHTHTRTHTHTHTHIQTHTHIRIRNKYTNIYIQAQTHTTDTRIHTCTPLTTAHSKGNCARETCRFIHNENTEATITRRVALLSTSISLFSLCLYLSSLCLSISHQSRENEKLGRGGGRFLCLCVCGGGYVHACACACMLCRIVSYCVVLCRWHSDSVMRELHMWELHV